VRIEKSLLGPSNSIVNPSISLSRIVRHKKRITIIIVILMQHLAAAGKKMVPRDTTMQQQPISLCISPLAFSDSAPP
jgi:hypothetical protein